MPAQRGEELLHLGQHGFEAAVGVLHLTLVGLRDDPIHPVVEFDDQAVELAHLGDCRCLNDDEAAIRVVDLGHARLRIPDAAADD